MYSESGKCLLAGCRYFRRRSLLTHMCYIPLNCQWHKVFAQSVYQADKLTNQPNPSGTYPPYPRFTSMACKIRPTPRIIRAKKRRVRVDFRAGLAGVLVYLWSSQRTGAIIAKARLVKRDQAVKRYKRVCSLNDSDTLLSSLPSHWTVLRRHRSNSLRHSE